MKKIYTAPVLQMTALHYQTMITQSRLGKYSGDGGTQLIKEDNVSSSSSRYNVWDDDWSD